MAIQGHSFGAYQANYLLTHTTIFAAASTAAGSSDLVSYSGTLKAGARDAHHYVATTQTRLGSDLWQRQDLYIKNSPIFYANKVTTPVMIMHNKKDPSVSWSQGVEFLQRYVI